MTTHPMPQKVGKCVLSGQLSDLVAAGHICDKIRSTICFLSIVQKELLIYPVFVSTEEINCALDIYPSSYSAVSHCDIVETVQMRYAP